jgi:hypothetical protein
MLMSDKTTMRDLIENSKKIDQKEVQQKQVPLPGDEFYVPPVTTVPLPSKGVVYPPDNALFDTDSLDVRAMMATDEDIMTSPSLIRKGKMLSALMRSCVVSRTIDPDTMLTGDRNALMVAIRNSTWGPEYSATIVCPSCQKENDVTFDLSRLSIKTLDVEPVEGVGSNVFKFVLPLTKREVFFRLLNSRQVQEGEEIIENTKKARGPGGHEENVTLGLINQIVRVSGVEEKKIPQFVRSLPARDSRALRSYIASITPDIDMKQNVECPACAKHIEVEVPLTGEFFWPKA